MAPHFFLRPAIEDSVLELQLQTGIVPVCAAYWGRIALELSFVITNSILKN